MVPQVCTAIVAVEDTVHIDVTDKNNICQRCYSSRFRSKRVSGPSAVDAILETTAVDGGCIECTIREVAEGVLAGVKMLMHTQICQQHHWHEARLFGPW